MFPDNFVHRVALAECSPRVLHQAGYTEAARPSPALTVTSLRPLTNQRPGIHRGDTRGPIRSPGLFPIRSEPGSRRTKMFRQDLNLRRDSAAWLECGGKEVAMLCFSGWWNTLSAHPTPRQFLAGTKTWTQHWTGTFIVTRMYAL